VDCGDGEERRAEWEGHGVSVACDFWDGCCVVSSPLALEG